MKSAAIQLVEVAYRLDLPCSEWLEALALAAAPLTPEGSGAMAYAFDAIAPDEGVTIRAFGADRVDEDFVDATFELNRCTEPDEAEIFYGEVVVCGTVSEVTGPANASTARDRYEQTVGVRGYPDTFGVSARGADRRGVAVNAPLSRPFVLDARLRRLWARVGPHLGASERLQRWLVAQPPAAVIEPSGRVAHAEGPVREPDLRARLVEAAMDIDLARSRRGPDDVHEALAMWKGLLDGRWSLVEQFERDGRRFFVAYENPPRVRDPRGLTTRERQVVELVAEGHANKHVAHELGVSLGTVAKLLQRALVKLGFDSRHQLVWVHRRLHRR